MSRKRFLLCNRLKQAMELCMDITWTPSVSLLPFPKGEATPVLSDPCVVLPHCSPTIVRNGRRRSRMQGPVVTKHLDLTPPQAYPVFSPSILYNTQAP